MTGKQLPKFIVSLLIIMFIFNLFVSGTDTKIKEGDRLYQGDPKKDPILASSISWYIPGGGQFYAGNYKKGLIFLSLEAGLFIYTLGLVTDYSYDLGNGFLMDAKNDVSTKDKELAWGLGTILLGLHIYNIVDAYKTVKKYNAVIDSELTDSNLKYVYFDRKDPFVAGLLSWKMPGLGQVYTRNYYKGSKFMLGSIVLKAWGIYIYQDLEEKYSENSKGLTWKELDENDKNLILTYGIFYLSFELINIFDAINAANEYNQKQRTFLGKQPERNLIIDPHKHHVGLSYTWKF